MSVFGVTTYLLVTQKGLTYIPFVRGTGFTVEYATHSFYSRHVLTAAHVAAPLRFPAAYGRPPIFHRIGQRHLTPKVILFSPEGKRRAMLPLDFNVNVLRGTSVAAMHIKGERELFERMRGDGVHVPVPFQLDEIVAAPSSASASNNGKPLVASTEDVKEGEELILHGLALERDEDGADTAEMKVVTIPAVARMAFVSRTFGQTVIVSTGGLKVTAGMSGCPVLRRSNGKCVGVLIAPVKTVAAAAAANRGKVSSASNRSENVTDEDQAAAEGKSRASASGGGDASGGSNAGRGIFNEDQLPRRINDEAAMQLALQEFQMAHQNLEPPCIDLSVGQEETLSELLSMGQSPSTTAPTASSADAEHFAAFVPLREMLPPLRFAEVN